MKRRKFIKSIASISFISISGGVKENTDIFKLKDKLIKRFNPGTCYGMPKPITKKQQEKVIKNNKELLVYIRLKYNIDNHRKIYFKIKQFKAITLDKKRRNIYKFTIKNGKCCTITTIKGTINSETLNINLKNKTNENVPC